MFDKSANLQSAIGKSDICYFLPVDNHGIWTSLLYLRGVYKHIIIVLKGGINLPRENSISGKPAD